MTRDADRGLDLDPDPDRACARDWQPVEAPNCRPETKCEDEPVQRSSAAATDASGPDPDLDPEPEPDADPNRERSRERAAEPSPGATPRADQAARAHDTQERDHSKRRDGEGVEPDVGGRHG